MRHPACWQSTPVLLQLTNAIKDATGNTFNQYTTDLYTIATANTTPPMVIAANPPASSTVGTNVPVELEFSVPNGSVHAGRHHRVHTAAIRLREAIAGTRRSTAAPRGRAPSSPSLPTAAYAGRHHLHVAWSNTVTDTAGNALTPGSFTFTTGTGPDTATNNPSANFNGQTNVGTNFAPTVTFSKPINPIDINTSTLLLYNDDSGKYVWRNGHRGRRTA